LYKYNDIIGLYEYFQPVYDLTNEVGEYWKRFIPNEKFYTILRNVLESLESSKAEEKKSFWMQGNYGTGKSHATAVVKHLLFDEYSETEAFADRFDNPQLQARLQNFRKKAKVFPVVLKGLSNVTNNRNFGMVIQSSVKQSLQKYKIEISIQSDFEKMIHHIENNPMHIGWDDLIAHSPQIRMYAKDKKALVKKLKDNDLEILQMLESLSSEKDALLGYHGKTDDWLADVIKELKSKKIADYLMIYWDEFTSVLQHPGSGMLLTELQHIAELSLNKDVHIFAVTHKAIHQTEINTAKEDIEKALGRFRFLNYDMEPITTYHIMGAAIEKKDRQKWEKAREEKTGEIKDLMNRILGADDRTRDYNLLKNLFPIHPYTAYLCTFIVRNIGSTERSIFSFLYDEERGFSRFIRENPHRNKGHYLTADFLWDFFMKEFERVDFQRFAPILDRFKLYGENVEKENPAFSAIFKGILLLNAQYKMVNVSEAKNMLVAPNFDNIKSMFWATEYQDMIQPALDYLDTSRILSGNPDHLYLVASSSLPFREIEKEKKVLENTLSEIEKILSSRTEAIGKKLTDTILRESECHILDASVSAHLLKSKVLKVYKKDHALHFAMLIGRSSSETEQARKTILKTCAEEGFEQIVFLILEELFEPKTYDQFIEYRARAEVADRHNFQEEKQTNMEFAEKVLDQWVHSLNNGYVQWYLGKKDRGKSLISHFAELVNTSLSEKIFQAGMEVIATTKENHNVWKKEMSKVCAENFLFASGLDDLQSKTPSSPYKETREIIKNDLGEYIVDQKLALKKDADPGHPLVLMSMEVEKAIDRHKDYGLFHLGDTLEFLKKPPFGLYPGKLHLAALGFLLRGYIGKLYESGKGKPVEKEAMREKIVSIFKYWENGKETNSLRVRLGTKDEKELMQLLQHIFTLKDVESLSDVKWRIREWIKKSQFPLWVFKRSSPDKDIADAIDRLTELIESVDQELDQERVRNILLLVDMVKTDLILLLKKEKSRELFISWLKSIDNITFADQETDGIIACIRQNMPEEIGVDSWKEDNVREKFKDWHIARLRKSADSSGKIPHTTVRTGGEYPAKPSGMQNTQLAETVDLHSLISEIKAFRGDWAKVLTQMVSNHPEIRPVLKKYMNDERRSG